MKIKVELFGPLVRNGRKYIELEVSENKISVQTFKKLIGEELHLSKESIDSIAIVKNDNVIDNNDYISSSDKICLLPPVSGG